MIVDDGAGQLRGGGLAGPNKLETGADNATEVSDERLRETSDGRVSERRRFAEGTGVMRAISVAANPRAKSPIEAIADAAYTKVLELKASGVRMAEPELGTLSMLDALSSLFLRAEPARLDTMRTEEARLETLRTEMARGSSADLTAQLTLEAEVELRADAEALDLDLNIADGVDVEASEEEVAPASSKRVRRRTKRDRPRSKTIAMKRVTRAELHAGALMYPPVLDIERPRTRAECKEEARPCPWVSCKHHLYLDINPETGSIKINFPDLEPWEMKHTCSLDVAEAGALTLEEIGLITNLTRERIRQVEVRGLLKLQARREIR